LQAAVQPVQELADGPLAGGLRHLMALMRA
jgi:hypothetical protein